MRGRYALENKTGAAGDDARPQRLPAARLVIGTSSSSACRRGSPTTTMALGVRRYALDRAARARRDDDARLRPRAADARLHQRGREHGGRRQRHASSTAGRAAARSATRSAASSSATRTARSSASRRRSACATATTRPARSATTSRADADWIDFDATVSHRRRPDRDRARLPAARVDRGRPALLPLQDGRADPRLLRLPVGALRGQARRVARPERRRARSRSTTSPGHEYNLDRWTRR